MRLHELMKQLEELRDKKFIQTLRKGPTGIGHLAETELGLSETNIAIPDIGGRVEMKATRKNANSLITLFTFNKSVWKMSQKDIVAEYGYIDTRGRQALYSTISKTPNSQGFYLISDSKKNIFILKNINKEGNIAEWDTYQIVGKFMTKLGRLLLIFADNKIENEFEYFHFKEAYLLEEPTSNKFLQAFQRNELMLDIRMHLKESGAVRNHGTAFRIAEKHLKDLYAKQRRLI